MSKSLAVAYQMKRKEKKLADGGDVSPSDGPVSEEEAKKFADGANFAKGGSVGCPTCGAPKMSEGGQVANDTDMSADKSPNEFDDLVERDGLEFKYSGDSSGDLVGRAMLKKAKR